MEEYSDNPILSISVRKETTKLSYLILFNNFVLYQTLNIHRVSVAVR